MLPLVTRWIIFHSICACRREKPHHHRAVLVKTQNPSFIQSITWWISALKLFCAVFVQCLKYTYNQCSSLTPCSRQDDQRWMINVLYQISIKGVCSLIVDDFCYGTFCSMAQYDPWLNKNIFFIVNVMLVAQLGVNNDNTAICNVLFWFAIT